MNIEIQPYFTEGERYPALIGVRVEGDEYETAYVSKGELADALTDNAKLRELVRSVLVLRHDPVYKWLDATFAEVFGKSFTEQARELGVEVEQ